MKQVLIIHGGDSFDSYKQYLESLKSRMIDYERIKYHTNWRTWIAEKMPEVDVLLPTFPNSSNAVYDEWKIFFEKIVPFLGDDVQLVGHSLGAMFLAKYLHSHVLPIKARRIILLAAQHDNVHEVEVGDIGSFKVESAEGVEQSTDEVHLFHSHDDPVVPYESLKHIKTNLPTATVHSFSDRGHFLDPTFPELLELLQK
ncbi:MAG TPA: alpha/beta hydrolase [Candidatus Saccharimonadaceae bacterium]|nr:alpha/beta hydrolase [Candidatus Saccharimonadaceae bacterium]